MDPGYSNVWVKRPGIQPLPKRLDRSQITAGFLLGKDFQIHNKKMLEFSIKRNKQKHVLRDFFSRLDEQSPLKKSKTELLKAFNLDG